MTDVDETIPLATLSITPQTPGITAGTGTVNTIPLATLSITPNAPGFQRYPLFEVLDSNGNRIDTVTFENLSAGVESDVQVLILVNNSGSSVDVTLTATIGDNGTLTETATSTLLSEDDLDYVFTTDTYTIPANSTLPVYIKWRPPSTSRPGLKTWLLNTTLDAVTPLNGWSYAGSIPIDGCYDGELTDHPVQITVNYLEDMMRTDFGDIRFTLIDETPLSYHLKSYTNSDSAVFVVKIPTIPAKPSDTSINIHSGKADATTTSSPEDVYLFFDDFDSLDTIDTWNFVANGGSQSVTDGVLTITGVNSDDQSMILTQTYKPPTNSIITVKGRGLDSLSETANYGQIHWIALVDVNNNEISGASNSHFLYSDRATDDIRHQSKNSGSWGTEDVVGSSYTKGDWVITNLILKSASLDIEVYNDEMVSIGTLEGNTDAPTGIGDTYYLGMGSRNGAAEFDFVSVSPYSLNPPLIGDIVWNSDYDLNLMGGVVYTIPDLPELDLQNHYIINVGGVEYE